MPLPLNGGPFVSRVSSSAAIGSWKKVEKGRRQKGKRRKGEGVSNEFRISLVDERRDYFKEIRNYLISGEKVINSGETN